MDIIWYLKYLSRIHEANMNLIFSWNIWVSVDILPEWYMDKFNCWFDYLNHIDNYIIGNSLNITLYCTVWSFMQDAKPKNEREFHYRIWCLTSSTARELEC